ncbi:unnamed protein product [Echinostoma caproni]|uniref:Cadherin domain-containing protein n=1 Tax=Echinostoma caproni TaxID=27848 RepID=A0A3P8FP98_9TREM|nr:unnamed protein product [Echinostoma caproni]
MGTLNATDADSGRNGTVHYRLAVPTRDSVSHGRLIPGSSLSGSQLVKVTHDGQITLYGVIDREQTPMIMVDVIAEDNGIPVHQTAMTTVTIHVLDLNDNKPRFVQPELTSDRTNSVSAGTNPLREPFGLAMPVTFDPVSTDATYKLNLSLDTSIGALLAKFEAVDPDYGPNGTVVFELIYSGGTIQPRPETSNGSLSTFTLHPDGRLILTNHLEFDTIYTGSTRLIPRRYRRPDHLLIRVSDQGPTPEHVITGVQITYHDASPILIEFNRDEHASASGETQNRSIGAASVAAVPNGSPDRVERRRTYQDGAYSRLASKQSYAYIGQGKSHGLPVLYILALAVCFALVLVITSLVYLYFKMRKPVARTQGGKHGGLNF